MAAWEASTRGLFSGERVAFTGRMATISRSAACDRVRRLGGTPTTTVSGRTTMLVVGGHGWPLVRDGGVSRALVEAERLQSVGHSIRVVPESAFIDMLRDGADHASGDSLPDADVALDAKGGGYPIERVAELIEVKPTTIRRWEAIGLIRSEGGEYDFQDIVSLQMIASLMKRGVQPSTIRESLTGLSSILPGTERPLAQLTLVDDGSSQLLAQIGDSLIAADGQHHLNFDTTEEVAADDGETVGLGVIDGGVERREPTADEWFEHALRLEEEEAYDEAAASYRRVIRLCPDWAEVYFNLGNVVRMLDRPEGAQELYRLATLFDPSNELVWYNLADVQEELEDLDGAVSSLRSALRVSPDFADAHFNLASCLERLGDRDGARQHWKRYLAYDGDSEWAALARRRIGGRLGA